MKRLGWTILIIVALLGVAAYLAPELLNEIKKHAAGPGESTTVYKWQDEQGNWHVTDEPPPLGVEHREQKYRHDTNVLPAPAAEEGGRDSP
ncbi:MAG: DUF4124 domain-containing protein [Gammaproteobacteria bacterium]|nr:DUF4124 domain-containing protein [Gammaproteobacteria bacterium]NIR97005.1 DUF4124 domain-containing protein [Gammaproteobacteria bacterium]NIT62707.1 DUF4124 domain-containing protein [Gammaproteobacteria bacterium]NIV19663.1 DUF4124 domain-containing protein [Gammaproteobacteria bacterium]NIY31287.1 DUF4124 domain-containing protein [Gammaproteobacteria bacterium]